MARRAFRGRSALRQGQRRMTEWGASADIAAVRTLAAGSNVLDQSFTGQGLSDAGLTPSTIVRLRGDLWVKGDAGSEGATETPFGALGVAVVTESARAAGVGSLPSPLTDEAADSWFSFTYFLAGSVFGSAVGLNADMWHHFPFDSKAMRKLDNESAIVFVLENGSSSAGMEYILKFRALFKLH